jgi:hypothetical protein
MTKNIDFVYFDRYNEFIFRNETNIGVMRIDTLQTKRIFNITINPGVINFFVL